MYYICTPNVRSELRYLQTLVSLSLQICGISKEGQIFVPICNIQTMPITIPYQKKRCVMTSHMLDEFRKSNTAINLTEYDQNAEDLGKC